MKPCFEDDSGARALEGFSAWLESPLGQHVAGVERDAIDALLEDAFGHFLVQIGCVGDFRAAFERSRIRTYLVLSERTCSDWQGSPLRSSAVAMPLASASVDALLLPHTLDFAAQPQPVLREVERVLIPEGRVLIIGFNPFSSWGLMRAAPHQQSPPWCGHQLTSSRLLDWLDLLGFQLEVRRWLLFRPPLRSAYHSRLDWLEGAGARWWPLFGGLYVLRAVKRVCLPTATRPRWRARPAFLPSGTVKPTAREGHHAP
jgi:SAM-dependent methyltransferase